MKQWGDNLWLLSLEEFGTIKDGTTLHCIDGTNAVKGVEYIDLDTRFGLIAYGFRGSKEEAEQQLHEQRF